MEIAKRAVQRAQRKEREKAQKAGAAESSEATTCGWSRADVLQDEVARAALEAARISIKSVLSFTLLFTECQSGSTSL
jgi:hypothetical protein